MTKKKKDGWELENQRSHFEAKRMTNSELKPNWIISKSSATNLLLEMSMSTGKESTKNWMVKLSWLRKLINTEHKKTFLAVNPNGIWYFKEDTFEIKDTVIEGLPPTIEENKERLKLLDSLRSSIKVAILYLTKKKSEVDPVVISHLFFRIGMLSVLGGIHYYPDADRGKRSIRGGAKTTPEAREEIEERKRVICAEYDRIAATNKGQSIHSIATNVANKYFKDYGEKIDPRTVKRYRGYK